MHYHTDGFSPGWVQHQKRLWRSSHPHLVAHPSWLLAASVLPDALYSSRPTLMPRCEQIACRRAVPPAPMERKGSDGTQRWKPPRVMIFSG